MIQWIRTRGVFVKNSLPRQVVDRSTILRHLQMSAKPEDPFSRTPLSEADILPNLELRDEIVKWLAARPRPGDCKVARGPHPPLTPFL